MNSYRLIKIVFVVLVLLTLTEAGYYLYFMYSSKDYKSSVNHDPSSAAQNMILTVTPSQVPDNIAALISKDTRRIIQNYLSKKNHSLYIIDEVSGYVKGLKEPGKEGYSYIEIADETGNTISTQIIENEDIPRYKFYSMVDNQKNPIKITDIRPGEKIITRVQTDLITDESIIEYIISK